MSKESISNYRRDIDGLRAISVLIVVAFHAFPQWVPGGFIGVDVFFVISGFLITGIILNDIDSQRFTILQFYHRRVRRIFPALLAVFLSVLLAGWLILGPEEYKQLGRHVGSSGLFFQNIALFLEAGYFDVVADYKPLLHLWSLSVEEQFYLFYPLFVVVLVRMRQLASVATTIALLSFGACLFQTYIQKETAHSFFLPHYRFWELMAGSLIQVLVRSAGALSSRYLPFLGIVLLSLGVGFTSRSTPFPGLMTLLPVVAAMCVLGAQPTNWFSSRVLGARLMVAIGLISYPLYLVHWPIFSFARIMTSSEPTVLVKWALIICSFALATLTYFFVEKPLRFGTSKSKNGWLDWRTTVLVGGMILSILAGYCVFFSGGVPSRTIASHLDRFIRDRIKIGIEIEKRFRHSSCDPEPLISRGALPGCSMYGPSTASETIVVWGDSHAEAWASVFFEIAAKFNKRVILFRNLGCAPLLDVVRTDGQGNASSCLSPERAKAIVDTVQRLEPAHVFLIARWSLYANGWYKGGHLQTETHFLTTDRSAPADLTTSRQALRVKLPATVYAMAEASPVTIVKTVPALKGDVEAVFIGRVTPTTLKEHLTVEQFPSQLIDETIRNAPPSLRPITVMNPGDLLCAEDPCEIVVNLTVMYKDDNHITPQGSLLYENQILQLLKSP